LAAHQLDQLLPSVLQLQEPPLLLEPQQPVLNQHHRFRLAQQQEEVTTLLQHLHQLALVDLELRLLSLRQVLQHHRSAGLVQLMLLPHLEQQDLVGSEHQRVETHRQPHRLQHPALADLVQLLHLNNQLLEEPLVASHLEVHRQHQPREELVCLEPRNPHNQQHLLSEDLLRLPLEGYLERNQPPQQPQHLDLQQVVLPPLEHLPPPHQHQALGLLQWEVRQRPHHPQVDCLAQLQQQRPLSAQQLQQLQPLVQQQRVPPLILCLELLLQPLHPLLPLLLLVVSVLEHLLLLPQLRQQQHRRPLSLSAVQRHHQLHQLEVSQLPLQQLVVSLVRQLPLPLELHLNWAACLVLLRLLRPLPPPRQQPQRQHLEVSLVVEQRHQLPQQLQSCLLELQPQPLERALLWHQLLQ
jgi:hypothetical protein